MRAFLVIVSVLLLLLPQPARSALRFGAATSDRVTIADTASIRLTETSTFTWLAWINITTFTGNREILSKNATDGNGGPRLRLGGTADLNTVFALSTTNASATSNNASLVTGTWYCVGLTFNNNVNKDLHLYRRTFTTSMAELTYSSTTNGVGTSGSTAQLAIGNSAVASPTVAFQGDVAAVTQANAVLTTGQMDAWCLSQNIISSTKLLMHLGGVIGTGTQPDWSGNSNNGTVSGATSAAHPFAYCPYCRRSSS